MHNAVRKFIKQVRRKHPSHFFGKKVLEVGSWNHNGTVRDYFWLADYLGIDIFKGKCVDKVTRAHDLKMRHHFDVVISTGSLEHDEYLRDTLRQSINNLKPGGLMLLTAAGPNFPEHGTTKNSPESSPHTNKHYQSIWIEDVSDILSPHLFSSYHLEYRNNEEDLMFYGIKK